MQRLRRRPPVFKVKSLWETAGLSEKSRNSLICSQAHLITLANYISHDNYIQYLNAACYFLFRVIKNTPVIGERLWVSHTTLQMLLIRPRSLANRKRASVRAARDLRSSRGQINRTTPAGYGAAEPAPHLRKKDSQINPWNYLLYLCLWVKIFKSGFFKFSILLFISTSKEDLQNTQDSKGTEARIADSLPLSLLCWRLLFAVLVVLGSSQGFYTPYLHQRSKLMRKRKSRQRGNTVWGEALRSWE